VIRANDCLCVVALGLGLLIMRSRPALAERQLPLEQSNTRPELLPRDSEINLALSAAPEPLRAGAGVYILEKQGYVRVRASHNAFTCVVNRDGPRNQKPTCYDAEGTATILPTVLFVGGLLMQGRSLAEIHDAVREGFRTGRFRSPRRPGVAYMLSEGNRDYDAGTDRVEVFPPHVMFYAPNLTNQDIGSDGTFAPGLPSIAYQGPQGFMLVVMPRAPAGPPLPSREPAPHSGP
jgi:hypothetical protein